MGSKQRSEQPNESNCQTSDKCQEDTSEQEEGVGDRIVGFTESIRFGNVVDPIRNRPEQPDSHRIESVGKEVRADTVEPTETTQSSTDCRR